MMRKYGIIIGIIFLFVACSSQNSEDPVNLDDREVSFNAEIVEVHEGYLMITPKKDEDEIKSADLITVSTKDVELSDMNGNKIQPSMFKKGMEVEIVYDGMIAESYPAQIVKCYEIRIISE